MNLHLPGVPPSGSWLVAAKQWFGVDENDPQVARIMEILRKKESSEITVDEHKEFLRLNDEITPAWEAARGKLIFVSAKPGIAGDSPRLQMKKEEIVVYLKGLAEKATNETDCFAGMTLPVEAAGYSSFSAPVILEKPRPEYTAEGRNRRVEGDVVIDLIFLAAGSIQILQVVAGLGHGLDEAAMQAAREIKFKPAQKDDEPCDFRARVYVTFGLV